MEYVENLVAKVYTAQKFWSKGKNIKFIMPAKNYQSLSAFSRFETCPSC